MMAGRDVRVEHRIAAGTSLSLDAALFHCLKLLKLVIELHLHLSRSRLHLLESQTYKVLTFFTILYRHRVVCALG